MPPFRVKTVLWMWLPLIVMAGALIFVHFSNINKSLFLQMNHYFSSLPDPFWAILTIFGDGLIIAVLFFPFIRRRPDVMLNAVLAMLLMTILVNISKDFFHVARPPRIFDPSMFNLIGPAHKARAFPSGHTATIFCFVGLWIFSIKNNLYKVFLFIFAILVGLSRIGVGVHWPADIAAGAFVGWISAFAGVQLARLFKKPVPIVHVLLGVLLAASAVSCIFFYSTDYPYVSWLRILIGAVCLTFGMIELGILAFNSFFKTMKS